MKKILFITLVALVVVGCKKETQIERNLWKNGGEWNISKLEVNQVSTYSADNYHEVLLNYGTYKFKKDGTGIYTFNYDGDSETGLFTYTNTENKIIFVIDGETRAFDLNWKKNQLTMTITQQLTYSGLLAGNSGTHTEIYNLEKK